MFFPRSQKNAFHSTAPAPAGPHPLLRGLAFSSIGSSYMLPGCENTNVFPGFLLLSCSSSLHHLRKFYCIALPLSPNSKVSLGQRFSSASVCYNHLRSAANFQSPGHTPDQSNHNLWGVDTGIIYHHHHHHYYYYFDLRSDYNVQTSLRTTNLGCRFKQNDRITDIIYSSIRLSLKNNHHSPSLSSSYCC